MLIVISLFTTFLINNPPPPSLQLHYLLYGSGFQTWEYSPAYALRSYGYITLHQLPMLLSRGSNKVT